MSVGPPAFGEHVCGVFRWRAKPQVRGVHTRRVVAQVHDPKAVGDRTTVSQLVHGAGSTQGAPAVPGSDLPVPLLVATAFPLPALLRIDCVVEARHAVSERGTGHSIEGSVDRTTAPHPLVMPWAQTLGPLCGDRVVAAGRGACCGVPVALNRGVHVQAAFHSIMVGGTVTESTSIAGWPSAGGPQAESSDFPVREQRGVNICASLQPAVVRQAKSLYRRCVITQGGCTDQQFAGSPTIDDGRIQGNPPSRAYVVRVTQSLRFDGEHAGVNRADLVRHTPYYIRQTEVVKWHR